MRVLALATYPLEAAASRYRIIQFIEPLNKRGIDVRFSPFLDDKLFSALYAPPKMLARSPRLILRTLRRVFEPLLAGGIDAVWVQREAMLVGPPYVEWFLTRVLRKPMVLDLDDATYISYVSPVYGRVATALKWPGKTDTLIRWSKAVVAGSAAVAEHATAQGVPSSILPTIVDPTVFTPAEHNASTPVIGWIGSHGTYPYVERLLPLFEQLAQKHKFRLRIIGSGRSGVRVPGIEVEMEPWRLRDEVREFRAFDIGIYPMTEDKWSEGKSGLKAVQYMSVGIPFVASPVGICATIGVAGETHFLARGDDEWLVYLERLLRDAQLRHTMGAAARAYAERHFVLDPHADTLASVLRGAVA